MNRAIITTALAALLLGSTSARADFTIDFDGVTSGSAANSAAPAGVQFFHGMFTPNLDPNGDPIPGSERWRIDPMAPTVTADNPLTFNSGFAPSGPNALNAVFQPVLMLFDVPFNLQSFSLVLDNDTFGSSTLAILFFGADDVLLRSLAIDQTQPGFIASTGALAGVSKIVLPGGAFYDSFNVTGAPVPEPSTYALIILAAVICVTRRKSLRHVGIAPRSETTSGR